VDSFDGREAVELVQGGELVRAGLDGVSGLVKELADLAYASVDGFGSDAEQFGDGDLGQGQVVVEDGGQEPVGQGEDRAAAGAGPLLTRGWCPRRLSRLVSRCWSCRGISVTIGVSQSGSARPINAG
jgi:hypothetical protein